MSSSKLALIPVALLFSMAASSPAFADHTVDFSNSGGTLSGTQGGLALSQSALIAVVGFDGGGMVSGDLGSVLFTTGALTSGSLAMGGTFAPGGTFVVNGNGRDGLPNGVLFSGSFTTPVTWALVNLCNGTHNYTLTGSVTGMMGGSMVNAVTVQLTINTGRSYFDGTTSIGGGDTATVNMVPEPSSLSLLTVGAIGIAGMIRRRIAVR